ncbi:cytochrome b561/polyisoprenoid-binding protein YceI [Sphingobium subterraneum]|uniref:Cytochrome b561/polyisoprenoid-binding protein YceI n=1 Tax=Sphingobium subterraneum TaxID=627688 RepID=A0A841J385_9SPHN|nr:cytochrome b561/polyisoprenoid-binding protein YceI [Sphingobium subterraneum]
MSRYSRTAMTLHWVLALLLAFQLALGWRLEDIPKGPALFTAFQLHKSIGILILVLTLLRLAVRLMRPRPQLMADSVWARRLAHAVHLAFYAVLIGAPLTGWALVSTARLKLPTLLFGTIPLPHLPLPAFVHEPSEGAHSALALLGFVLFLLHVAGALRHQFVKDENILGRMIPLLGAGRHVSRARAGVATLVVLGIITTTFVAARFVSFGTSPTAPVNASAPAATLVDDDDAEESIVTNSAPVENATTNATAPALAAQPLARWTVASGGRLGFTASWNGTAIAGRFGSWKSDILFSPDALDASRITVTIDLASASTDDSQRDEMLQGGDFFDTAAHPQAVFTSSAIRSLGGDRYKADGSLQLHGVSKPVTLSFTLKIDGDTAKVTGSSRLDRTKFGVGTGEWAATDQIAAPVSVDFAFSAKRSTKP